MKPVDIKDLQASVQDKEAFTTLDDFIKISTSFLATVSSLKPTRIVSPKDTAYIFYQYGKEIGYRITRPINTNLFIEADVDLQRAWERLGDFLSDLHKHGASVVNSPGVSDYLRSGEINKVIYTTQQSIGCIGDSFTSPNQARKRIGQLFETLVRLIIQSIGFSCESRTLGIPIPGYEEDGYKMSYELDLVFSRDKAIITSETAYLHPSEVVGSVKTTSKDRIDKIFLDKFMLTRLLGREIPVIAIFLHDVQRARSSRRHGNSIFGVNSTFKTNHFLGYTVALNRLDGVYYVDPRPIMKSDERLLQEISDFQTFIVRDIWRISS